MVRWFTDSAYNRTAELPNRRTLLPLGPSPHRRPHVLGETVQLLQDGIQAGPGKVEDRVADAQARVGADVFDNLLPGSDERRPASRGGAVRELDGRPERQGDSLGVPTRCLGLVAKVGCRLGKLIRMQPCRGAEADGMPPVAESGRPADGRPGMPGNPDGWVRLLDRLGI